MGHPIRERVAHVDFGAGAQPREHFALLDSVGEVGEHPAVGFLVAQGWLVASTEI